MDEVVRRIHRLRKYAEREARLKLMEASGRTTACEARLGETNRRIDQSRAQCNENRAGDMAAHHEYALKMEMVRRHNEMDLIRKQREEFGARNSVKKAAMEARIMEKVADSREAEVAADVAQKNQVGLDEIGLQGWWRRSR